MKTFVGLLFVCGLLICNLLTGLFGQASFGGGGNTLGYSPLWTPVTISYTQLTAAATTQTITLLALPANGKLQGITVKHTTAFTGASLTGMTVSVGGAATTTDFTNPFNIFQAVSNTAFLDNGGNTSGSTMAAQNVTATFISTGQNLGNGTVTSLTGGSVTIWVLASVL